MKKFALICLELLTAPALLLLISVSMVGRGAHAVGRYIADTIDELEA